MGRRRFRCWPGWPRRAHAWSIILSVAATAHVPHAQGGVLAAGSVARCRGSCAPMQRGLVGMVDGEDMQALLVQCERRGDEVGVIHGATAC